MTELTMSELIRFHRKRLKMTQAELAFAAGVSRNYISIIERGYTEEVSWRVMRRVLDRLGIDIKIDGKTPVGVSNKVPEDRPKGKCACREWDKSAIGADCAACGQMIRLIEESAP